MDKPNGTQWVEPGQGATISELWSAVFNNTPGLAREADATLDAMRRRARPEPGPVIRTFWRKATNLRLTGAPLTAEDLKRIAEAK